MHPLTSVIATPPFIMLYKRKSKQDVKYPRLQFVTKRALKSPLTFKKDNLLYLDTAENNRIEQDTVHHVSLSQLDSYQNIKVSCFMATASEKTCAQRSWMPCGCLCGEGLI